MGILDRVLRAGEGKKLKALEGIVPDIGALEDSIGALSDDALQHKTVEFRERLDRGEFLDDLLVEAFAVTREAATRVLGQRHYDVQLRSPFARSRAATSRGRPKRAASTHFFRDRSRR